MGNLVSVDGKMMEMITHERKHVSQKKGKKRKEKNMRIAVGFTFKEDKGQRSDNNPNMTIWWRYAALIAAKSGSI